MTTMSAFKHHDLSLPNPSFDSPLVDVLTELEHLRRLQLGGSTPAPLFFQLKEIFHLLESLGSARIEGNHTTLADYVETKLDGRAQPSDQLQEMLNIERAMDYIEETIHSGTDVIQHFVRELHALTVQGLDREGDKTPGQYRQSEVAIAQSTHLPPYAIQVQGYMDELVGFVNKPDAPKYDLIKVAVAHHRFGWIHPFSNGNGRVVRLLTYALLIKYGFNVQSGAGRVLNPTAVFCNDRNQYYAMLGMADTGSREGQEAWCVYVLQGILDELRKVDQLTDFGYLQHKILIPALTHAKERGVITEQEKKVLLIAAKQGVVKAADLAVAMPGLNAAQRTYQIKKLVETRMLQPVAKGARQYTFGFSNNYLIRGVIHALTQQGFIPETLNQPQ